MTNTTDLLQRMLLMALAKADAALLWNAVAKPHIKEATDLAEQLIAREADMRDSLRKLLAS